MHQPDSIPAKTGFTNESEEATLRHIESRGWSVIGIPEDNEGPSFSYTIGLYKSFGHPELFLCGLPHEVAISFLNDAGELIRTGRKYSAGERTHELAESLPMTFCEFPGGAYSEYLGWALWYYEAAFPVLQLVWPDATGAFPWEQAASPSARALQPLALSGNS